MNSQTTTLNSARPRSAAACLTGAAHVLVALAIATGGIAHAQETKPAAPNAAPGSTVLAPAFAEKLALARITWPTAAEQAAARDLPTVAGRAQSMSWLITLLTPDCRPFATQPLDTPPRAQHPLGDCRPTKSEYFQSLTTAVSADEADLICTQWTTTTYRFQFIGAQDLIRLAIEPVQATARKSVTPDEAVTRVREFLGAVINDSNRLLNFCSLLPESTAYGYVIRVHAEDMEAWQRQFQTGDPEVYHRWILHLTVHTDGVSFVLDVKPMTSANVRYPSSQPMQRWFTPPGVAVDRPHPTTAPALGPDEVQAKLRLLEELARQRREQRNREGQ